jgi:hypothetical protein
MTKRMQRLDITDLPTTGLAGKCCKRMEDHSTEPPFRLLEDHLYLVLKKVEPPANSPNLVKVGRSSIQPFQADFMTELWFCPFCGARLVDANPEDLFA